MVFNPQLTQNITPIEVSSGPNVASVVSSALGFTLEGLTSKTEKTDSFSQRWEEFTQTSQGLSLVDSEGNKTPIRIGDAPAQAIFEFERRYPEYSSKIRETYADQQKLLDPVQQSTEEARIKNAVDKEITWTNSPDYMYASTVAVNTYPNDPAKQKDYLTKARAAHEETAMITAKNNEAVKAQENVDKVSAATWKDTTKIFAPRIAATTQGLVSLFSRFQQNPNGSINIAEEAPDLFKMMPELAGFSVVNRDNLQYFAQQLKTSTLNLFQKNLTEQGMVVTTPPKEWVDANFAVMDNIITDAGADLSNEAMSKRYSAKNTMELNQVASDLGFGMSLALARETNDPSLFQGLKTAVEERSAGKNISSEATATVEGHVQAVGGASIPENITARNLWQTALTGNFASLKEPTPSGLTGKGDAILGFCANQVEIATDGGKDPSGSKSTLSVNAYNSLLVSNSNDLNKLSNENPEFKNTVGKCVKLDVGRDVDTLRKLALEQGISFTLKPDGSLNFDRTPTKISGALMVYSAGTSPKLENEKTLNIFKDSNKALIDAVTGKMVALGALGEFGKSVMSGLISPDTNEEKATSNIGQTLGIDFTSMETEAGLPSGYLEKTASIESGGNPDAVSPTGATGLFQFTKGTAKDVGLTDRKNPVDSTKSAVRLAVTNKNGLIKALGREPTGGELYLAHQQGLGGASALLKNSNANVIDALLPAYNGNKDKAEQAIKVNGGNVNMTAGEFANIWISKYNGSSRPTTYTEATGKAQPEQTTAAAPVETPVSSKVELNYTPMSVDAMGNQVAPEISTQETETTTTQTATAAAPTVSKEGQALIASLGTPDATFTTNEEFLAASAAGKFTAGDVILVDGVTYVIRKDGTPVKVGG